MENKSLKKCVFVLEDDNDLRELFEFMLTNDNYLVKTYPDATTFRSAIGNESPRPNVILMDVRLPDGNGLDICEELKANPELSDIPVIMMSAHMNWVDAGQQCNAEDFIEKPFDINDFLNRVEKYA